MCPGRGSEELQYAIELTDEWNRRGVKSGKHNPHHTIIYQNHKYLTHAPDRTQIRDGGFGRRQAGIKNSSKGNASPFFSLCGSLQTTWSIWRRHPKAHPDSGITRSIMRTGTIAWLGGTLSWFRSHYLQSVDRTDSEKLFIDTDYLVPYGIVGYLLSKITGIPYILRHGGSDWAKFLHKGLFSHLLGNVVQNAAAIITDNKNRGFFKATNSNVYVLPRYIPDEKYFTMISHEVPTFAYIGKINHYWKYKSLDKIVDIFSGIKEEHTLHLVGQGKGFGEFAKFVEAHGLRTHEFRKFVHPVNMPYLLGHIDYLLYFSQDNPIKDFSNIVCEAVWSGVPVITDRQLDIKEYTQYTKIVSENH